MEDKSLFGKEFIIKDNANTLDLNSTNSMLSFLKQFIKIEEEETTPYKHKFTYYNKKAHYINGKKVNAKIYKKVKA